MPARYSVRDHAASTASAKVVADPVRHLELTALLFIVSWPWPGGKGPMNEERKIKLPIWAVILDVIGALLLAAGLILLNGGAGLVNADPAEMKGPGIALIVMGVLLMVPLIAVILVRARSLR
jgi:hypothetical protein